MSKIVPFHRFAERKAEAVKSSARKLIDEFGPSAGLRIGRLARSEAAGGWQVQQIGENRPSLVQVETIDWNIWRF